VSWLRSKWIKSRRLLIQNLDNWWIMTWLCKAIPTAEDQYLCFIIFVFNYSITQIFENVHLPRVFTWVKIFSSEFFKYDFFSCFFSLFLRQSVPLTQWPTDSGQLRLKISRLIVFLIIFESFLKLNSDECQNIDE
jgi:hypothetical protein